MAIHTWTAEVSITCWVSVSIEAESRHEAERLALEEVGARPEGSGAEIAVVEVRRSSTGRASHWYDCGGA